MAEPVAAQAEPAPKKTRSRKKAPAPEAIAEPMPEAAPEPVLAAVETPAEPKPAPVSREPDPAEISTPPTAPRRGWWRRG
jgi:ribonuclease E